MYSQEEINKLVIRLKDYYPNRPEEAMELLTNEYELPMPLVASIMYLVKTLSDNKNCFVWPVLNARGQPFYVN